MRQGIIHIKINGHSRAPGAHKDSSQSHSRFSLPHIPHPFSHIEHLCLHHQHLLKFLIIYLKVRPRKLKVSSCTSVELILRHRHIGFNSSSQSEASFNLNRPLNTDRLLTALALFNRPTPHQSTLTFEESKQQYNVSSCCSSPSAPFTDACKISKWPPSGPTRRK